MLGQVFFEHDGADLKTMNRIRPAGKLNALRADDVRALTDIGYIALSAGLHVYAAAIFAGVQAARPAHEAGFIGRALVHIACGEVDAAIKTLRSLPPTDTARTFLAMALIHHGDQVEAHKILVDVINSAADGPASALARAILDEFAAQVGPRLHINGGRMAAGASAKPLH